MASLLPGIREWALVALVVVAFYGRSVRVRPRRPAPAAQTGDRPAALGWLVERWKLAFAVLAGMAVAAWLATSSLVARWSAAP